MRREEIFSRSKMLTTKALVATEMTLLMPSRTTLSLRLRSRLADGNVGYKEACMFFGN